MKKPYSSKAQRVERRECMSYSEAQKENAMKAMCELCEMCINYGPEICQDRFPCRLVAEAFDKVIEILEDKNGQAKRD